MSRGWGPRTLRRQQLALVAVLAGMMGVGLPQAGASPTIGAQVSATPGPVAPRSTARFVALGDSYASGVGVGDYHADSGSCLRSPGGYPELLASAMPDLVLDNLSCAGATTADVVTDQLAALTADSRLVTLTVGGNDAGFATTMNTCLVQGEQACLDVVAKGRQFTRDRLPGLLDDVFTAVRDRAPDAAVHVVGYPHLFETAPTCTAVPLTAAARLAVNRGSDALDRALAAAAVRHGFGFVDVRDRFEGHGVCSQDPWVLGVTEPAYAAFHPTATGQRDGYLAALSQALDEEDSPSVRD